MYVNSHVFSQKHDIRTKIKTVKPEKALVLLTSQLFTPLQNSENFLDRL